MTRMPATSIVNPVNRMLRVSGANILVITKPLPPEFTWF